MKISIVIATYYRQDGKTSEYLRRALDSIYPNYPEAYPNSDGYN